MDFFAPRVYFYIIKNEQNKQTKNNRNHTIPYIQNDPQIQSKNKIKRRKRKLIHWVNLMKAKNRC